MKININNKEAMSENETYFWIVQLISGDPESGGIVAQTELITKKWERVEDRIESWQQHIDSGEFYAHVIAVRSAAEAFFAKS